MQLSITTLVFGLPTGQQRSTVEIVLPAATLTIADLIALKVRQEIQECLAGQRQARSGEYLTPEELLGARPVPAPQHSASEVYRAQQAFAARTFMVVVDGQRLNNPAQCLTLKPDSCIEFIKILPLVGG